MDKITAREIGVARITDHTTYLLLDYADKMEYGEIDILSGPEALREVARLMNLALIERQERIEALKREVADGSIAIPPHRDGIGTFPFPVDAVRSTDTMLDDNRARVTLHRTGLHLTIITPPAGAQLGPETLRTLSRVALSAAVDIDLERRQAQEDATDA